MSKSHGTAKPIKQEASQGGRVMRQEREKESMKAAGTCGKQSGKKSPKC